MALANISTISLTNLTTGNLGISLNLPDGGFVAARLTANASFTLPPTVNLDILNRCADFHTLIDGGYASMTLQQGSGDLAGVPPEVQPSPGPWLSPCRLSTSDDGNIDLTTQGLGILDGVTPSAGDRIAVTAQTDTTENGVYLASAGAWTRAPDSDQVGQLEWGSMTYVQQGSGEGNKAYRITFASGNPGPITPGTTAFIFNEWD
jgi:hypothetical protein